MRVGSSISKIVTTNITYTDFGDRFHLFECLFNGTSSKIRKNNETAEIISLDASSPDGLSLGRRVGGTSKAYIDIAECILYSAEVTGNNLTNIRNYLNREYHLWHPVYSGDYL